MPHRPEDTESVPRGGMDEPARTPPRREAVFEHPHEGPRPTGDTQPPRSPGRTQPGAVTEHAEHGERRKR